MRKRIVTIVVIVILSLTFLKPTYAYDGDKHDQIMEEVLFGKSGLSNTASQEAKDALDALKAASYLTIDFYNSNSKGKTKLDDLRNAHVPNLPESVKEIDYTGNSSHRSYTHLGWTHDYGNRKTPGQPDVLWKHRWELRKDILRSTVTTVLKLERSFGPFHSYKEKDKEKCESLCVLIYYVHVMGDHMDISKCEQLTYVKVFAGRKENNYDKDIISDLKHHLEILFSNQKSTHKYNHLMNELDRLYDLDSKLYNSVGNIDTDDELEKHQKYVENTLDLLTDMVPELLKKEDFFSNVFYADS